MTEIEMITCVRELEPVRRKPSPRPHPSTNMGGFTDGKGVYEVEEKMLFLYFQLSPRRWARLFQWQRWKLWVMCQAYWPTTIKSVLADRKAYLESL